MDNFKIINNCMRESTTARKAEKLSAVKGMNDILPPESARWEKLECAVRVLMRRYAYENIRTPIVEPTALFVRGLGEVTDIVEKEMYSFEDRLNGEALTLRPENTAGPAPSAPRGSRRSTSATASSTRAPRARPRPTGPTGSRTPTTTSSRRSPRRRGRPSGSTCRGACTWATARRRSRATASTASR